MFVRERRVEGSGTRVDWTNGYLMDYFQAWNLTSPAKHGGDLGKEGGRPLEHAQEEKSSC